MKKSDTMLRLIALFKLFKAALLLVVGLGVLKLIHRDVATLVEHWVEWLRLDPHSRYIGLLLEKAPNIAPNKIAALGLGSLVYAGLFFTEGIGLWLEKRWAEWFTVIITSSLVPIEIYEMYRHPSPVKISVLLLNIAIVVYLVCRIRNSNTKVLKRSATRSSGMAILFAKRLNGLDDEPRDEPD